jgi:hypothetical protein
MTNNDDIHPFAPAGGGGAGAFSSVQPMGMNPKMDKWMTPEPLGTRQHRNAASDRKALRRFQNEVYLKNVNVKAFLDTLAKTEGGDYHAKYGWVQGRDGWSFCDESTHPGYGKGGKLSPAGRYQINLKTWKEQGIDHQGLEDFSPHTQPQCHRSSGKWKSSSCR